MLKMKAEDKSGAGFYDDYDMNECIYPINLYTKPRDFPLATILYTMVFNTSFNLAYMYALKAEIDFKNLSTWKFFLKLFLKRFLYFFLGINQLYIRIVQFLLQKDKFDSLEDYLMHKYIRSDDTRKLVHFKKKWIANPGTVVELLLKTWPKDLGLAVINTIEQAQNEARVIDNSTPTYLMKLKGGGTIKPHKVYPYVTKESHGWAWQTSTEKYLINKEFIKAERILSDYKGGDKRSCLLSHSPNDLKVGREIPSYPWKHMISGAVTEGYITEAFTPEFNKDVKIFEQIYLNASDEFIRLNISEADRTMLLRRLLEEDPNKLKLLFI
jgi:hypothetical protein